MLGVRGIAEEVIRFNGYPFLDKDEHAPNVPGIPYFIGRPLLSDECLVASVMKTNLRSVMSEGMTTRDVGMCFIYRHGHALITGFPEHLLSNSQYRGFPVVSTDEQGILLGYIERAEIQWVMGETLLCLCHSDESSCLVSRQSREYTTRRRYHPLLIRIHSWSDHISSITRCRSRPRRRADARSWHRCRREHFHGDSRGRRH